jgi:hypothetical protein
MQYTSVIPFRAIAAAASSHQTEGGPDVVSFEESKAHYDEGGPVIEGKSEEIGTIVRLPTAALHEVKQTRTARRPLPRNVVDIGPFRLDKLVDRQKRHRIRQALDAVYHHELAAQQARSQLERLRK